MIPVERTHEFRGRYHVLGGALSPIDGVDPEDLHLAELYTRVEADGVTEVVIATNPTTTGEATAMHIADTLRERSAGGRGHPAGQRPARGRRSRVRRRGHPRQGLRGAPPAVMVGRTVATPVCRPPAAPDRHPPIRFVSWTLFRIGVRRPASTGDGQTGAVTTRPTI